ncbi:MAG TPA: hypothetical protein VI112_04840 [Bacteroidia bacterium]
MSSPGSQSIDLGFCSVTLRPDGIIHTHFFSAMKIELEHVMKINEACGELTRGAKVPMFIDGDEQTIPSESAMRYVSQKNSNPYALAEAYILKSLAQKLIADLYLRFNRPGRPTRMFTKEGEALQWLREFLPV